jgi:Fe2+ or Zn2+ uptake regulation protein
MVDVPEDNYSLKCCRAKGFKARCVCILFKGVCKDCA